MPVEGEAVGSAHSNEWIVFGGFVHSHFVSTGVKRSGDFDQTFEPFPPKFSSFNHGLTCRSVDKLKNLCPSSCMSLAPTLISTASEGAVNCQQWATCCSNSHIQIYQPVHSWSRSRTHYAVGSPISKPILKFNGCATLSYVHSNIITDHLHVSRPSGCWVLFTTRTGCMFTASVKFIFWIRVWTNKHKSSIWQTIVKKNEVGATENGRKTTIFFNNNTQRIRRLSTWKTTIRSRRRKSHEPKKNEWRFGEARGWCEEELTRVCSLYHYTAND